MTHLGAGGLAFVAAASLVAAAVNSVAGGGSLLSFPALLLVGYSPLVANITNTVGLVPGYAGGSAAYRPELRRQWRRIRDLGVISIAGAVAGAFLLTITRPALFQAIVPWLILAGCALNAAQPFVAARVARAHETHAQHRSPVLGVVTFGSAVYGAFFGAGLGVMLVGVLGVFIDDDLQRLNALKGVLSLIINVVAAVYFIALAHVAWEAALVMLPASLLGGFAGVALARRLSPGALRVAVVVIGVAAAIRLLV
jgi:uncharacterized membrane protein YfcA